MPLNFKKSGSEYKRDQSMTCLTWSDLSGEMKLCWSSRIVEIKDSLTCHAMKYLNPLPLSKNQKNKNKNKTPQRPHRWTHQLCNSWLYVYVLKIKGSYGGSKIENNRSSTVVLITENCIFLILCFHNFVVIQLKFMMQHFHIIQFLFHLNCK